MINKFKIVKNFLTNDELKLLQEYVVIKHRVNFNEFDHQDAANSGFYSDPIMESLMLIKNKKMNELTSKELLPTYTCWRMYTAFSELSPHKDRPACEYSCTVMISSDKTEWPIFMDGEQVSLMDGDAVIYKGCDVKHWREEFKGDYHAQCFIHYVDKNGPYANEYMDKRPVFGYKKK